MFYRTGNLFPWANNMTLHNKRDYLAYYVIYRENGFLRIAEHWNLSEAIANARLVSGRIEHGNFPMEGVK